MLWYKSWLETRWRFVIGLVLLMLSAIGTVLAYPEVMKLMPMVPPLNVSGEIAQRIREAAELAREYRGYVWFKMVPAKPDSDVDALCGAARNRGPARAILWRRGALHAVAASHA